MAQRRALAASRTEGRDEKSLSRCAPPPWSTGFPYALAENKVALMLSQSTRATWKALRLPLTEGIEDSLCPQRQVLADLSSIRCWRLWATPCPPTSLECCDDFLTNQAEKCLCSGLFPFPFWKAGNSLPALAFGTSPVRVVRLTCTGRPRAPRVVASIGFEVEFQ